MLGEGAFGMVVKAEAKGISGKNGAQTVAVKMLKGGCHPCLPIFLILILLPFLMLTYFTALKSTYVIKTVWNSLEKS